MQDQNGMPPEQHEGGIGVEGRGDVIALGNPWQTGNLMFRKKYTDQETGYPTLLYFENEWWQYDETKWRSQPSDWFNQQAYVWLSQCQTINGGRVDPAPRNVRNVFDVVRSMAYHDNGAMPAWIRVDGDKPPGNRAEGIVAFQNALLDIDKVGIDPIDGSIETKLIQHTPRWFSPNVLPFPFDPKAKCPRWLDFLDETFRGDRHQIDCLHEWFGYCLTQDTSQQKCAIFVGPKRTGKSTVCRILGAIVGKENVATPTLSSLSEQFGMMALVGKTVAIVGDAHLDRGAGLHVLEKIKAITGEDNVDVRRMYLPTLSNQRLRVRFTISCNEIPDLPDVGATLGPRMLGFAFTNSVVGEEDRSLTEKLLIEIPGVLAECIRGLARLRERGELLQPDAGAHIVHLISDDADGTAEFLDEWCLHVDDMSNKAYHTLIDDLYKAFIVYRKEQGSMGVRKEKFLKRLHAVRPGLIGQKSTVTIAGVRRGVFKGIKLRPEFLREFGHCDMAMIPTNYEQMANPHRSTPSNPGGGYTSPPSGEKQGTLGEIPI